MKSKTLNKIDIKIPALSQNESLARQILCSFASQLDPTVEEIGDLRVIISEAVTNCVVHAYRLASTPGYIYISAELFENRSVKIRIRDTGCGIEDIEKCMQPFYTTDPAGERGGMGFPIMKELSDKFKVASILKKGTTITLYKKFGA